MFLSHLNRYKAFMSSVALCAMVAGCADSTTKIAGLGVANGKHASEAELAKSRYVGPDAPSGPLRERNGLFLAGNTRENSHGTGLPAKFETRKFTFVNAAAMTFREITDLVTRQTGLPVVARFTMPKSATFTPQQNASADISHAPAMAQGPVPAGFDTAKALAAAASQNSGEISQGGAALGQTSSNTMSVNYSGPLPGFLDLVGDTFGLGWEYEDGRIAFTRTQIATFDIPALPIVMKLAFSLDSSSQATSGGAGGGAQQSGGSSQKAATDAAFNLWTDIDKTIRSIVSTDGSVDISGSTGTVTINAPSIVVKQVRKYVQRINKELSREIVMGVDVYSIELNRGDNYNFDLNVAFTNASRNGLGLSGAAGTAGTAAVTTVSTLIANAATNSGAASGSPSIGASVLNPSSKFAGSNALLTALSTQGDVSIVNSANLTTLNGIPAPFQVVNTRGYVASVATTTTSSTTGSSQTTLTPGSVTTGFNLYIVPRVDRNGTVMLQYGVNISELVGSSNGFDTFTSGGQTVQLPNINARNFVQEASVPVGDTLVLTGFEQKNDKVALSGVGDPNFPFLGGSNTSSHSRTIVVVAITPRIISFGQNNSVD